MVGVVGSSHKKADVLKLGADYVIGKFSFKLTSYPMGLISKLQTKVQKICGLRQKSIVVMVMM